MLDKSLLLEVGSEELFDVSFEKRLLESSVKFLVIVVMGIVVSLAVDSACLVVDVWGFD